MKKTCKHAGLCYIQAFASILKVGIPICKRTPAVQKSLQDTVLAFRSAFLTQMPSNGLKPPEMERLDADINDLREFFGKFTAVDKVEKGLEGLESVQKLAQCESVDEFEETFGFMLMDEHCKVRKHR